MSLMPFLRSLVATVIFILITLVFSIIGIISNILFNRKKNEDLIISTWARWTCFLFGVEIQVHGKEKIPAGGHLILFNHSSFFDIFALASSFSYLRFGAKSELFKIPFFGLAMKRAGTLPIARGNREEVFKVYEDARTRFSHGECFALSAEGGRFYSENLSKFKSGPFIFALSAKVPIVPVIILGAHEVMSKTDIIANKKTFKAIIDVHVLDPISTDQFNMENRHQLISQSYQMMNSFWVKFSK